MKKTNKKSEDISNDISSVACIFVVLSMVENILSIWTPETISRYVNLFIGVTGLAILIVVFVVGKSISRAIADKKFLKLLVDSVTLCSIITYPLLCINQTPEVANLLVLLLLEMLISFVYIWQKKNIK